MGAGSKQRKGLHHGQYRKLHQDDCRLQGRDRHHERTAEERAHRRGKRPANENAPSHRVFVGRAEIGAAWSKQSQEGRDYLSVKLDDPSFVAPIYANLFAEKDGETFNLVWTRSRKTNGE